MSGTDKSCSRRGKGKHLSEDGERLEITGPRYFPYKYSSQLLNLLYMPVFCLDSFLQYIFFSKQNYREENVQVRIS